MWTRYGLALGFVLATVAGPAGATVITDVELYQNGETIDFGAAPDGSDPYGVAGASGLAGQISLTTSSGGTIDAWCMDLFHDVYLGANQALTYTGVSINGASDGNGGTVGNQLAAEIAGLVNYGNNLLAAGGTLDQSAGIQMAIWNLEYPDLTYTGPTAAVADWQLYMALAPGLAATIDVESMVSLTGTQELVAYADQIPEPAAAWLLATGLLALLGVSLSPEQRRATA